MNVSEAQRLSRIARYVGTAKVVFVGTQSDWSRFACQSESDPERFYLAGVRRRGQVVDTRCDCPAGQHARECKHQLASAIAAEGGKYR